MDKGCALFPWFWCLCSLPYVFPSTRVASVGVWIRFYGQGLRLSLCGFGARVFLARRWYADTAMGMVSLVSPWSWCSCVLCHTLVCGFGLWAWIALSLRGPGARVFSAMKIPQLQYFPGGRWPCSVLSRSDRGDSTGIVLRSVDDVPVVVQRQVQGQTVQKRAGTAVAFKVVFRRGAEAGSIVQTVV